VQDFSARRLSHAENTQSWIAEDAWMQYLEVLTAEVVHELETRKREGIPAHTVQYLHSQILLEWGKVQEREYELERAELRAKTAALSLEDNSTAHARRGW